MRPRALLAQPESRTPRAERVPHIPLAHARSPRASAAGTATLPRTATLRPKGGTSQPLGHRTVKTAALADGPLALAVELAPN